MDQFPAWRVRFEAKILPEPNSGCWIWDASRLSGGYGQFHKDGKVVLAHRLSYETYVGPIPEGLEIDHKCRMRCCVNPAHLEPVTHRENGRRGIVADVNRARMLARTHCKRGHPYSKENVRLNAGVRVCRACANSWRFRRGSI